MTEQARNKVATAIVGNGLVGIAVAHYLAQSGKAGSLVLVDPLPPMSLTSASSGENFRNWWPHPVMTAFTNDSIDRMQAIGRDCDIDLQADGYLLATRQRDPAALIASLTTGYGDAAGIALFEGNATAQELAAEDLARQVDVIASQPLIRHLWPHFDPALQVVVRIRRAGRLSVQKLGQWLLDSARGKGLTSVRQRVTAIEHGTAFTLTLADGSQLEAEKIVLAPGPFINDLVSQFEAPLPVTNLLQQKITFQDHLNLVPRNQPFAIDMDSQPLAWSDEERSMLEGEPELAWLAGECPGGSHFRPDGAGRWVKLGWAYNRTPSTPMADPPLDDQFPEIVLRGAARLYPELASYIDQLPAARSHYGGYYTMTAENWPLIGPLRTPGAFVAGALSGFGTMAACAAGALCAQWVTDEALPEFARPLSLARHDDKTLMAALAQATDRGVL